MAYTSDGWQDTRLTYHESITKVSLTINQSPTPSNVLY